MGFSFPPYLLSHPSIKMMALLLLALPLFMAFGVATGDPILSCSQTPYPHACNSMASTTTTTTTSLLAAQAKTPSGFRNFVLRTAMDQALRAHELASAMDTKSLDDKAKAAWADCLVFSEDTINKLNRSTSSPSNDDSQTWLSAAMANLQMCQDGLNLVGSSSFPPGSPFTSFNMSELLSNALAVNKAMAPHKIGSDRRLLLSTKGFPKWISATDRKLIQSLTAQADLVVSKDGSGDFETISEALAAAATISNGETRFVIRIKAGIYQENVMTSMNNLMIIGDGKDSTVITGSKSVKDGSTVPQTATFKVTGNGFMAGGITFENTAGPCMDQALAFLSTSDNSVLHGCSFKGYQDTLCAMSQRQLYYNCDIYGTIDFIFGDSTAVFQNCIIYVRKPQTGQENTVTAQGRSSEHENTVISIYDSAIKAAPDLKPVVGSVQTYLGRPWRQYSRTIFMQTELDSLINPAGWLDWPGQDCSSTLYYGEYGNQGPGADTSNRVKWPGLHVNMNASEASQFTPESLLGRLSTPGSAFEMV